MKKPQKTYKGYVKFPLGGADTQAEFSASCEYYGDLTNPRKRYQIFKRPRRFRVEIWIKAIGDSVWDVTELTTPADKLHQAELVQIMQSFAVSALDELPYHPNGHEGFFKIFIGGQPNEQ